MNDRPSPWEARITVRLADPEAAGWLEGALRPEATREVPRAQAEVVRSGGNTVELRLTARDTGSIRAALNTYLGWVQLAVSTAGAARRRRSPPT